MKLSLTSVFIVLHIDSFKNSTCCRNGSGPIIIMTLSLAVEQYASKIRCKMGPVDIGWVIGSYFSIFYLLLYKRAKTELRLFVRSLAVWI